VGVWGVKQDFFKFMDQIPIIVMQPELHGLGVFGF
jgi:hypothetical protein